MMAVSKRGASRQEMHERLREHALAAWQVIQIGEPNPLVERLQADEEILKWISAAEIEQLSEVSLHIPALPKKLRGGWPLASVRQLPGKKNSGPVIRKIIANDLIDHL